MISNSNNIKPTISIIAAAYNCANTIESSILSILPQLSEAIEFIIIDGGSRDNTIDIIKKYENYLAYWKSEEDEGIYDAWNKAIIKSKGTFIAFIGLDDYLCENYASAYLPIAQEDTKIDFISSKMIINNTQKMIFGYPWEWQSFKKQMNVVHPGSLHNRSLFETYGMYSMDFKIAGDYEFLLRIGNKLNTKFINAPTVIFSLEGVSNTKSFQLAREIRKAKLKNKSRSILMINIEFLMRYTIAILSNIKKRSKENK